MLINEGCISYLLMYVHNKYINIYCYQQQFLRVELGFYTQHDHCCYHYLLLLPPKSMSISHTPFSCVSICYKSLMLCTVLKQSNLGKTILQPNISSSAYNFHNVVWRTIRTLFYYRFTMLCHKPIIKFNFFPSDFLSILLKFPILQVDEKGIKNKNGWIFNHNLSNFQTDRCVHVYVLNRMKHLYWNV